MIGFLFSGTENLVDKNFKILSDSIPHNILLIIGGSWVVALMAQISIPLGFTPVPITGQTFAVLLIGCAFGAKKGGLSLLLYLLQGSTGLPFFANGSAGLATLLGPSGGYLIGMFFASIVIGTLSEKRLDEDYMSSLVIFSLAHIIIFSFGLLWLGKYVGYNHVVSLGLFPFIPGLVVKTIGASLFAKYLRQL